MGDIMNSVMHRSAVVAHHSNASRRVEMIQDDYEIVIINYDGLGLVADEIIRDGRFDMVIVDECFVAGTQIATPGGNRSIEKLKAGDTVVTSDGVKRIKRLICNASANLVTVRTSDGKETTCTADHPFFTDAGWITAKNLVGRRLVCEAELSCVSGTIPAKEVAVAVAPLQGYARRDDLLTILRSETVSPTEPGGELLQPDTARGARESKGNRPFRSVQGAYVSVAESDWAQAPDSRGERYRDDTYGAMCRQFASVKLGLELSGSVGAQASGLSHELQVRLCKSRDKAGVGSGWELPQYVGQKSAGQEEGSEAGGVRVVSVTHHEQGSARAVYNLEVEGTPHYFANGNLVHNCNSYANVSTRRWKTLAKILTPKTYLWMMTGTPAAQSPLHAYGLAKLVNPSGVPNYATAWRDKVMNKLTMFKWVPKSDAKDKVFAALQPAIRFKKSECVDLPPVLKTAREVDMTPQQRKYYEKIKTDALVVAAGTTISAVNKAAVVGKLLQISQGFCIAEDHTVVQFDATPRMNLLLEILAETDKKVLIFAMFRASIDGIAEFLIKNGVSVGLIHGGIPANKRGEIIHAFQNTPTPQVMLMQPQAAAHGITLTAADTVVFYGPLMSVELYTQGIARADRQGQTSDKVTVVHIQSSPIEKKMFAAMDARVTDHALLTQMFDDEMEIDR
jgi:hypothetical protein